MRRALEEYQIVGVRTTLPFARWLMEQPHFISGDLSTDFIAQEWDVREQQNDQGGQEQGTAPVASLQEPTPAIVDEQVAAIVGALLSHGQAEQQLQRLAVTNDAVDTSSRWRDASRREILRRY
jgi:acetyl/propionyl-CoA carboxylase alpha subunit